MQTKKVILITGASSGIGYAAARTFLQKGWQVFAAARRVERMQSLAEQGAHLLALDVTNQNSAEQAIKKIRQTTQRIDVLVNNAGYGSYGAIEDVDLTEAQRQIDVNLLGVARMVKLVLPTMRQQHSGRIINVSSMGGLGYGLMGGWYHATKHGLEAFSDALRLEVADFNIQVSTIEPGATRSEWEKIAEKHLWATSGKTIYQKLAVETIAGFRQGFSQQVPAQAVADDLLLAATVKRPKFRYPTGATNRILRQLMRFVSDRMMAERIRGAGRRAVKKFGMTVASVNQQMQTKE